MNVMKKIIFLVIIHFIATLPSFSQFNIYDIQDLHISPQAYQFAQYGNTPIKHSVGELDLSIPLYTYKDRDFEIPLILQYAGNGFMPNKHEGIIGLDWFLNVGGCITRKIEGIADENIFYGQNFGLYGVLWGANKENTYKYDIKFDEFIKTNPVLNIFNAAQLYPVLTPGNHPNPVPEDLDFSTIPGHYNKFHKTHADLSPDIFSFYMPGHSGRFNINWDGSIQLSDFKQYKVEFDEKWYYGSNSRSIKITTSDGYIYIFGGTYKAIEKSLIFRMENNNSHYTERIETAWHLTKIIAPNGRFIEFIYKDPENFATNNPEDAKVEFALFKKSVKGIALGDKSSYPSMNEKYIFTKYNASGDSYYREESEDDKKIISHGHELQQVVYLDKININNESTIELKYINRGKAFYNTENVGSTWTRYNGYGKENLLLSNISVKNNLKQVVSDISFYQENLGKQGNNGNSRFFLKKVRIGADTYKLDYYDTDKITDPITPGVDHWGYSNGGNKYLPSFSFWRESGGVLTEVTSNSRSPKEDFFKVGALKEIVYPTGGKSEFIYDQHDYIYRVYKGTTGGYSLTAKPIESFWTEQNKKAGGARIKGINVYDSEGELLSTKEYIYRLNLEAKGDSSHISSGILLHSPEYVNEVRWFYGDRTAPNGGLPILSCNIHPSGSELYPSEKYIQYSKVIEKNSGNGYKIYEFSNIVTNPDIIDLDRNSYEKKIKQFYSHLPYGYPQWGMGSDGAPKWSLLSLRPTDRSYRRGILKKITVLDENKNDIYSEEYVYDIVSSSNQNLTRAINHGTYLYNKFSIENFAYKPFRKKETTFLNGKPFSKTTIYEYDSKGALSKETDVDNNLITRYSYTYNKITYPYFNMVASNILTPVIEKEVQKNNSLIKEIVQYSGFYNDKIYRPSMIFSFTNNNPLVLETEIKNYDLFGNSVYILKGDATKVVYLWSYNSQYPIAEIKNATYDQIKGIISETNLNAISSKNEPTAADWTTINNLRSNPAMVDAHITTYKYKPLVGITQMTDPTGVTIDYEYDSFGRLKRTKDMDGNTIQEYDYHYKNQ